MNSYFLENEFLKAKLTDYGATLVSLVVKNCNIDVVLGFDDLNQYCNEGKYIGQTIGRVCNRIGKGRFELNNQTYITAINSGPNSLHGGRKGFDTKTFEATAINDGYRFTYCSKDMEEGYPGDLCLQVDYLLKGQGLEVHFEATSTKDTVCSFTNHAFFNLKGKGTITDHTVWIDADYIGEIDKDGLSLPQLMLVDNTPFDFRVPAILQDKIQVAHPQLINGNGYDHNYVFNTKGYGLKASLSYDQLLMRVYTDYNHMHLYSGNYLGNQIGKNQQNYESRCGICFETQHYPNAINYEQFEKPILRKGETYRKQTRFEFTGI